MRSFLSAAPPVRPLCGCVRQRRQGSAPSRRVRRPQPGALPGTGPVVFGTRAGWLSVPPPSGAAPPAGPCGTARGRGLSPAGRGSAGPLLAARGRVPGADWLPPRPRGVPAAGAPTAPLTARSRRQRERSGREAMSCGELFQVYSARAVAPPAMPVDLAMRLCGSHSPPIRKLLNSYEELRGNRGRKPLRSCLNQKLSAEPERRDSTKSSKGQKKKRVVFADMKGLSLTAVRFFSKIEEDLCDLQHALSDLACFRPRLQDLCPEVCRYVLDFPQPSVDYTTFRSRLHSNLVCLENCLIQDRALSGTVKVRNIEYEKKVMVRISFDGWKSFRDISCQYMHSTYGSADTDIFSFELALPKPSVSCRATEFCISFQCGQNTHWDNNHGRNYRICHTGMICSPSHAVKSSSRAWEHLGTSRAAALVLSHLQTWRRSETQAPYW
ncbi:protein phosphatase 1 regulatory subunit 3C-B-like [Falco naumanni]|uniref:protein phosphatase 1 regulatory subunit 3C-B-like n=1 Tax=Falco naumanni TaxID=148594 RepID=UPI001ADDFF94|nr:protein phosphatase 1 regulatory subunit 3C-B-like [Falco naumanni]